MRGAFVPADALSTTPETLRLMIDVNLGPTLWLSQAVAPHMQVAMTSKARPRRRLPPTDMAAAEAARPVLDCADRVAGV